jgi:hypothetical protein
VAVTVHEAEAGRDAHFTLAGATNTESAKKRGAGAVEHADVKRAVHVRHDDDESVGAHAAWRTQVSNANVVVEVEGRRQHLHAVVVAVRDEHEVVGCDPHLVWGVEVPRLRTPLADDTAPRAVQRVELVDGVRAALAV